ncbi:hypothetical protein RND81_06G037500 [Saponaria officinalis]|uniref:Maternal effect embryo arrest 59 n=1 Tax=Saponaria officinalis TaxID=3572 RepID=A0AAW1K5K4_SAPOF
MLDHRLPIINKPSRSDEMIEPEQQLRLAHEVGAYFESIKPKRPTKPSRSEPDPDASLTRDQAYSEPIPELQRLNDLKSQSQVVLSMDEGVGVVQEEFVETEYYRQLETVDKQHHTTGTGFIKIERGNEKGQNNELQRLSAHGGTFAGNGIKSNPATNDWTPSSDGDDQYRCVSDKPSRSG